MSTDTTAGRSVPTLVVLLDNDLAVLSSLTFVLETEGMHVRAYQTAARLLSELDAAATGCLVLDYHLSDGNGLDLLKALRKSGVAAPAIVITSNPTASLRERAAAAGATVVEKPFLGNALLDEIRASLHMRQ